jgi:hypothetical protein
MEDNPIAFSQIDWGKIPELLKKVFSENNANLRNIRSLAEKIKVLINKIDPLIQEITSIVCPYCEKVCCINKHAHYDIEDLIYVYALGLREPSCQIGIKDTDSCIFLTENGCSIDRYLRPFRCNWYFCEPLLKKMEEGNARTYRAIINLLEEILKNRRELIDEFSKLAKNKANLF